MPYLPPPRLVWAAEVEKLAVALNDVAEGDVAAFGMCLEWQGGVEVGERAVDDAYASEGVGGCGIWGGEGGDV